MKKGKQIKIKNLQINLSNKTFYTLVLISSLILFGVAVYALTPGTAPNPGHLISEVAPPNPCGSGQFLKFDGVNWVCADVSGVDNLGNHIATQNIHLNNHWLSGDGGNEGIYVTSGGNVGIGTATPTQKLDVNGKIKMRTQTASTDAQDIVATKGYVDKIDIQYALAQATLSCPQESADKLSTSVSCPAGSKVIDCWIQMNGKDIPMWAMDYSPSSWTSFKIYTTADVATNSCSSYYQCGGFWNGVSLGVKAVCLELP